MVIKSRPFTKHVQCSQPLALKQVVVFSRTMWLLAFFHFYSLQNSNELGVVRSRRTSHTQTRCSAFENILSQESQRQSQGSPLTKSREGVQTSHDVCLSVVLNHDGTMPSCFQVNLGVNQMHSSVRANMNTSKSNVVCGQFKSPWAHISSDINSFPSQIVSCFDKICKQTHIMRVNTKEFHLFVYLTNRGRFTNKLDGCL